jgi:hypothetical protein
MSRFVKTMIVFGLLPYCQAQYYRNTYMHNGVPQHRPEEQGKMLEEETKLLDADEERTTASIFL